MFRTTLRTYYLLAKPGIVYGNALSLIAGYLYGAHGSSRLVTFAAVVIGTCLVMASACVFNNVLDRSIDARMARTKQRAVVTGRVVVRNALLYASTLLVGGALLIALLTNILTLGVALIGHLAYVVLYGWAKRHTVHSTLIGTISGATPPVIGYTAATGQLDLTAGLLFLLLVTWQMAHFFSIAIFRRDDYAAAKLPVLSVVGGMTATRRQIVLYVAAFLAASILFYRLADTSLLWVLIVVLASGYWLLRAVYIQTNLVSWARQQFTTSLGVLLVLCAALSLEGFLH